MPKQPLQLGYTPATKIVQGIVEYETPNDMYMGVLADFLENAGVISRKGRLYLSFKPYNFRVRDTSNTMITLPGSNYHDPIPWLFAELFDWIAGPVVAGGRSVRFDKHRRTVYPRANGEDDWSYKTAFGSAGGQGQLEWARRHLRMDPASRSCVVTPWDWERDLVRYTARKELEISKGQEYQRLPCILGVQFSTDDTLPTPDKKGLNSMVMQRALDFTGAAHTDLYRLTEASHWLAKGSYPGGFGGHFTTMAGTCVIESFGAQRFVEFRKLLEWWSQDKTLLSILDHYTTTNQCLRNPSIAEAPRQKAYNWFHLQWQKTEIVIQNAIKNQWNLFEERIKEIEYGYYRDYANTLAVFEWNLMEELAPEIKAYHWDAKQCMEAINWGEQLGEYPPFYWLGKINNWMQYYVSAELARKFIVTQDWEKFDRLMDFNDNNRRFQTYLLMDASRFLRKNQLEKLRVTGRNKEFFEIWDYIFDEKASPSVLIGGLTEPPNEEGVSPSTSESSVAVEEEKDVFDVKEVEQGDISTAELVSSYVDKVLREKSLAEEPSEEEPKPAKRIREPREEEPAKIVVSYNLEEALREKAALDAEIKRLRQEKASEEEILELRKKRRKVRAEIRRLQEA